MRKTTSYPSSSSDALSVDTAGLQKMLNSGRQTATQIGMAAGAKFCVGRRVYWNVAKIRKYLDEISEYECAGAASVVESLQKGKCQKEITGP